MDIEQENPFVKVQLGGFQIDEDDLLDDDLEDAFNEVDCK